MPDVDVGQGPPPQPETPQPLAVQTSSPDQKGSMIGDIVSTIIPERVAKLGDKYGRSLFVGFILGLILGGSVAVGILANSESLRALIMPAPQPTKSPPIVEEVKRERLTDLTFSIVDSPESFLRDYETLLGGFGESKDIAGTVEHSPVGVVYYQFVKHVQPFTFKLWPRFTGSDIDARVFHEMTLTHPAGTRITYEPIFSQDGSPTTGFRYKVSECNPQDKLFVVVLVNPRKPDVNKFTDYFDVKVE